MKTMLKTGLRAGAAVVGSLALAGTTLAADWSYEGTTGPDYWGSLDPAYEACSKGLMQSPIDLAGANARGEVSVFTDYKPGPLTILNNGHTVQANFASGSRLISGTQTFDLLQVHFHTPSEEELHGEQFPMVAHFVHADSEGSLGVLGVLFEAGDATNPELEKIIASAPRSETSAAAVSGVTLDPRRMVPDVLDVYRFQGSLTTPPCTEGVDWHVAIHPVEASAEQLTTLRGIIGNNARPVQPLNGRLLVAPGH
ncbi:MAG: carbonic anhydrase family protein [Pontixanthobacter sp.]